MVEAVTVEKELEQIRVGPHQRIGGRSQRMLSWWLRRARQLLLLKWKPWSVASLIIYCTGHVSVLQKQQVGDGVYFIPSLQCFHQL